MSTVDIRPGVVEDLPTLTEIYNHYVAETAVTFDVKPFSTLERQSWFDAYASAGPHRLLVAVDAGMPIGYATSSRFRPKAAYDPSVETTIYLHPDHVGRGHGSRLYGALFEELAREGVHRCVSGITLPNDASVALHERFGFQSIGVFREIGFKQGRYWDVEWFEKSMA